MAASGTNVVRVVGFTSLLLGPVVIVLDRLDAVDELTLFVLAAAALIPISWLIGEATDNLARYTGPGIGGFLNATFGNAPELIIAIVAIADGLTEIVRASLVGSIVGNLLLVLGFTLLFGQKGKIDRLSAYVSLGLVAFAGILVLVAATPGFHGDPDRRSLAVLSLPLAVVLLIVRVVVTRRALRRQRSLYSPPEEFDGWTLPTALVVLGLATVVTALVTETLVEHAPVICGPSPSVRVLRRGRDRGDRRKRDRARQCGGACATRKGQARGRDLHGVERSDRGPPDPAGRLDLLGFRSPRPQLPAHRARSHRRGRCLAGPRSEDRENDSPRRSRSPVRLLGSRRLLLSVRRPLNDRRQVPRPWREPAAR